MPDSDEFQPQQAPPVADQTVIAVLQNELNQANGNRVWLLARNAELENELRVTRTELESMRDDDRKPAKSKG